MKHVVWSDNVCTVGLTNIHGYFDANDLMWLKAREPRGTFRNTFYHRTLTWRCGIEDIIEQGLGDRERGYYFTFPDDAEGEALITFLSLLLNRRMVRGEHN